MQVEKIKKDIDKLQSLYGDCSLASIYGAGCIKNPKVMFIFMNPTGKNVSAYPTWKGLRAPWLGTKNVWNIFYNLGFISKNNFQKVRDLKPTQWTEKFSFEIYSELSKNKVYITNLAKCTQIDARPLKDKIFRNYLDIIFEEVLSIDPKFIISFGNQVSSILLGKKILVGSYKNSNEILNIKGKKFKIYPVHYPVGQGMRNMPLAIKRIKSILS